MRPLTIRKPNIKDSDPDINIKISSSDGDEYTTLFLRCYPAGHAYSSRWAPVSLLAQLAKQYSMKCCFNKALSLKAVPKPQNLTERKSGFVFFKPYYRTLQ